MISVVKEDTFGKKTSKKDPVVKSNNRSRMLVAWVGVVVESLVGGELVF